jgi:diguanylate cyclase
MKVLLFLIGSLGAIAYLTSVVGSPDSAIPSFIYLLAPFLPVLTGIRCLQILGWRGEAARPIRSLVIGYFLFLLGEILWYIWEFGLDIDPFPSMADLAFLSAYPFLFWGFISQAREERVANKKLPIWLWGVLTTLGLVAIGLVVYFGIYLRSLSQETWLSTLVLVTYGIADILLTMICLIGIVMTVEYRKGLLVKVWGWLAAGVGLLLIADIAFLLTSKRYLAGEWWVRQIDVIWIFGYVLAANGLVEYRRMVEKITARLKAISPKSK